MAKMKESDLVKIIDDEIVKSQTYGTKIAAERAKALRYYNGELYGNEKRGRSTYVSREVSESISWAMPQIMKILTQQDLVQFEPESSAGVQDAELATHYANHVFNKQNDGFSILHSTVFDALLQKNGIVKIYLDTTPVYEREEYEGLTMLELTQLADDDDVEIIEKDEIIDETPEIDPAIEAQLPQILAGLQSGQLHPDSLPPEVMEALGQQEPKDPRYNITSEASS